MAEDNNQDMAMEDILSSIKNILEADETQQSQVAPQVEEVLDIEAEIIQIPEPEPEIEAEVEPIIDEQAEVNIDDILDLSPEMQVEEPFIAEVIEPQEINLDAELDNIEAPFLEEETHFEIADDKEEVVLDPNAQSNVKLGWEDFDSDPFDAQAAAPAEVETEQQEFVEQPIEEPVAIYEPEPEVIIEPAFEPVVEVYEPEPEVVAEPEPIVEEPKAVLSQDAADISANIINNFTKMFSHAEPKVSEPEPTVAPNVNLVGDGTKTIEDVVADVIKKIIGAEVEQNWRANADYDTFAKEVIRTQATAWLDENLPKVVETIVKQEIERVMAKVGSNQ